MFTYDKTACNEHQRMCFYVILSLFTYYYHCSENNSKVSLYKHKVNGMYTPSGSVSVQYKSMVTLENLSQTHSSKRQIGSIVYRVTLLPLTLDARKDINDCEKTEQNASKCTKPKSLRKGPTNQQNSTKNENIGHPRFTPGVYVLFKTLKLNVQTKFGFCCLIFCGIDFRYI